MIFMKQHLVLLTMSLLLLLGFWASVFIGALRHGLDLIQLQRNANEVENLPTLIAKPSSSSLTATTNKSSEPSRLLPGPLDMMRRGVPLDSVYSFPDNIGKQKITIPKSPQCSCLNPGAKFNCCERRFCRTHKMGCLMSEHLFDAYKPQVRKYTEPSQFRFSHQHLDGNKGINLLEVDFREILLLRNIYSSLVSGYLYHVDGREW